MSTQNGDKQGSEDKKGGFSFSLQSSKMAPAKRKEPEQNESSRDFVLSMSSGQIESTLSNSDSGPLVIPLPEQKKTKLHKKYLKLVENKTKREEEQKQEIPVTPAAPEVAPPTEEKKLGYGLNLMKKPIQPPVISAPVPESKPVIEPGIHESPTSPNLFRSVIEPETTNKSLDELALEELLEEAKRKSEEVYVEADENVDLPLLLKNRNTELDEIQDEEDRFRADVASRPSETSLNTYERVPIEAFGKALLRGMGWSEGGAIGLTNPQVVQPIEYLHRPGYRTGLGATPMAQEPPQRKKYIKPGESREPKEIMVATDDNGTMKSVRRLDDKLVALSKLSLHEGAKVAIIAGEHSGLNAVVRQMDKSSEKILVRLERSEEDVLVYKKDVEMLKKSETRDNRDKRDKEDNKKSDRSESDKKIDFSKSWLFPNLVVRVVSKSFQNGKLYLKKGTIVDVIAPGECVLKMHESRSTIEVKQGILETVIPRTGGFIMVVSGSGKGKRGVLKEKENGRGLVQLDGELEFGKYSLDDICQFGE